MRFSRLFLRLSTALILGSVAAQAYYHFVRYPIAGQWTPVPCKLDLAALPNQTISFFVSDTGPDTFAANDSLPALISQLRLAADVWNSVPTSDLHIAYGGLYSATSTVTDNTPKISVVFDEVPPGLLALGGFTVKADAPLAGNGTFVPIPRSVLILRKDLSARASYQDDFFVTLVHEFGHTFGLQHTLTSSVMSTQVTRGTTKAEPLGLDDQIGVSLLYPKKNWRASTGSISGRVTASGSPVVLASVVAYTADGPAVSSLTNPDGTYQIDGLPAGQYSLYVHPLPPPLAAETTPDNITLPLGHDHKSIAASAPFDLAFYSGTRDPQQSPAVTVAAGAVAGGTDFAVSRTGSQTMYAAETYGFPPGATSAVRPPIFALNPSAPYIGTPFFLLTGYGVLNNNGGPLGGIQATVLGDSTLLASGLKASYAQGYLELDLDLSPSAPTGPRHLLLQSSNESYVLPNALLLVNNLAPVVSSVTPGFDANGNRMAILTGNNFNTFTRFIFDGIPVPATSIDASTVQVTPPAAPAGYKAVVGALNSDGQSSLQIQGDNPPVYSYGVNTAAAAAPVFTITPALLPAGVQTTVDVISATPIFSANTVLGFASSDIAVTKVYTLTPNHLLASITISVNASAGPFNATITNGLQVYTVPSGFAVSYPAVQPFSFNPLLVNAANSALPLYPGATGSATLTSQPYPLTNSSNLTLTIAGQNAPVTLANNSSNQILFTVPQGLPQGPTLFRLQIGQDYSLPIVIMIGANPPTVISVLNASGLPVDQIHGAHVGDTIQIFVSGWSNGDLSNTSRIAVTVGGVNQTISQVTSSGIAGVVLLQMTLSGGIAPALQSPVVVSIDGVPSSPLELPVY